MMRRFLPRFLYTVTCFGMAWYACYAYATALPQYKNEALTISTLLLYVITFPSSLAVQEIYVALMSLATFNEIRFGTGFSNWIVTTWGPLAIAGYFQWFYLLPRFFRYWAIRRDK